MSDATRAYGAVSRLRPRAGREEAVAAHMAAWHRTAGRVLPGTRLHLLFDIPAADGEMLALHLFESAAAYRRCAASERHQAWEAALAALIEDPPAVTEVAVRWNAAADARPQVAVSIDRDVHATVQDLIGRLLARHPRTPAEDAYLNMLQSVAADYERDFPLTVPEEEDLR